MWVPGLCASIYSVFCFKWRGVALVTSEWLWVATEKSERIELIAILCFFNAPVCHSSPPASFPTWPRQRGVSIGSPFSPRLPMLHQRCFDSLDPSLVVPSKSFCPHPSLFLVSICLPLSGELTSKCLSALDEECQFMVWQATGIITLLLTILFANAHIRVLKDMDPFHSSHIAMKSQVDTGVINNTY